MQLTFTLLWPVNPHYYTSSKRERVVVIFAASKIYNNMLTVSANGDGSEYSESEVQQQQIAGFANYSAGPRREVHAE